MRGRTHLSTGLLAGAVYAQQAATDPSIVWMLVGAAGIGALMPDIDTPKSKAGVLLWITGLPSILHRTVGHRTLTHSLLCMAILALAVRFLVPAEWLPVGKAFLVGYLAHVLGDLVCYYRFATGHRSKGGVTLFWPVEGRVSFRLIEQESAIEDLIWIGSWVALALLVINRLV